MNTTYLPWLTSFFYGAATLTLIKHVLDVESSKATNTKPVIFLSLLALGLHLSYHALLFYRIGGLDVHFFSALSLVGLGMSAFCIGIGILKPLKSVGIIAFPIAGLSLLLDAYAGHPTLSSATLSWQIGTHAILALLAYATLCIASLVAITLALQEHLLRHHHISRLLRVLPPLVLMENLLFQLILVGFALLTFTLITGVLFVHNLLGQHLVHKTLLSIASWLVFGSILWGRWRWGWRGKKATRLCLTGMTLLLLAFVGSKFVLEVLLHRR
jgi:ABC-type uncharacterized transport system permease subunit